MNGINISGGDSLANTCLMIDGGASLLRAMRIEGWLNEELDHLGIKDKKFYLFRNRRRPEIFWIFFFQRSQIRWYRDMQIKLDSDSPEA